jgi:uncharacterized protein YyaL (SSP411 family)
VKYLDLARKLQDTQDLLFWDSNNGGYFSNESSHELLFRPKTGFDGAEPSVNGVSSMNLYRLYSLLNDDQYEHRAQKILGCYAQDLSAQPFGYCSMLGSLIAQKNGMRSVLIVGGDKDADVDAILFKIRQSHHPNTTVARLDSASLPFFKSTAHGDEFEAIYRQFGTESSKDPKVIICENGACRDFDIDN